MTKREVEHFFPPVEEYDSRSPQEIDDLAEFEDISRYVEGLIGDSPSSLTLLDYSRRLLDATVVVEEWKRSKLQWKTLLRAIDCALNDSEGLPDGILYYWDRKEEGEFDALNRLIRQDNFLGYAMVANYTERLQKIFNDPNGRYVLEYGDFCRTGGALVINEKFMRRLAILLLNRAEDALKQ
jgi:hypothetical protein